MKVQGRFYQTAYKYKETKRQTLTRDTRQKGRENHVILMPNASCDSYSKENVTSVKYNLTSLFDMNSIQPKLEKKRSSVLCSHRHLTLNLNRDLRKLRQLL